MTRTWSAMLVRQRSETVKGHRFMPGRCRPITATWLGFPLKSWGLAQGQPGLVCSAQEASDSPSANTTALSNRPPRAASAQSQRGNIAGRATVATRDHRSDADQRRLVLRWGCFAVMKDETRTASRKRGRETAAQSTRVSGRSWGRCPVAESDQQKALVPIPSDHLVCHHQ